MESCYSKIVELLNKDSFLSFITKPLPLEFCLEGSTTPLAPFVEETVLSLMNDLCTPVENQLTTGAGLFLDSRFIPVDFCVSPPPLPHNCDFIPANEGDRIF